MPNVITHGLMANEVIQLLEETEVASAIDAYPRLFFFGSNGPDFLFYYRFMSHDEDALTIRHYGNLFHDNFINEFYTHAKEYIKTLSEPKRSMTLSYIAGHLCHWALDSLGHPYIFHKTGLIKGDTRYDHYRMEAMIDTLVVKRVKNQKYSATPSYKFVRLEHEERLIVAKVYQYIIKNTTQDRVELSKLYKAIKSMYQYNLVLWNRTGLRNSIIAPVERFILKDPWVFTSHFVIPKVDLKHDLLNLKHLEWSHPCDPDEKYTTSFMDLFNQSIIRGSQVLKYLAQDLENEHKTLEEFIDGRNYSTGRNTECEMFNFNLIYQH